MPMFDDPRKELKRLEQQLLKEEEWMEQELDFAKALIGDEPAPQSRKRPAQRPMEQTQVYRTQGQPQVRNYANGYGAKKQTPQVRNFQQYDVDLDEMEAAVPRERLGGLVTLACVETLGIVAVVAYWLIFLL